MPSAHTRPPFEHGEKPLIVVADAVTRWTVSSAQGLTERLWRRHPERNAGSEWLRLRKSDPGRVQPRSRDFAREPESP
jgi:hypothetical protein